MQIKNHNETTSHPGWLLSKNPENKLLVRMCRHWNPDARLVGM